MNKYFLLILFFLSINVFSFSQIFIGEEAKDIHPNAKKVWLNKNDNTIKFIEFEQREYVQEKSHSTFLGSLFSANQYVNFKLNRRIKDNIGQVHYRYDQYYKNHRVVGAQFILHTENNKIISANGEYIKTNTFSDLSNFLRKNDAIELAMASVSAKEYAPEREENKLKNEGEIVVLKLNNTLRFAYKIDVYALQPLARFHVYVDALNGEILRKDDRIHEISTDGTAHCKYHGVQTVTVDSISPTDFRLNDNDRNIATKDLNNGTNYAAAVDFTDTDNIWNTTTNQDDAALDAHYGAEMTYDFFFTKYGLDSYNGSGASINSFIHYGNNFVNAFWNGTEMTYGDGDGIDYSALTSIDVVGHEISHAVTEYSANLVYSYESGALNESFSDIFGVAIDFFADPANANWKMGDLFHITGDGFRDMANPNAKTDPDTYLGTYWHTSAADNGGVHTNSGVQNFWYYLLTQGGSGLNDISNNYNVVGIGMDDATDIAYRNLSVYLTTNSQYSDARFYAIQAAVDLFGACSLQEESTTNAWYAVGIGALYSNSVTSSFSASQTYFCTMPASVSFTNSSINDSTRTWDFGDGSSSTLLNPTHTYTSPGVYTVSLITNGTGICGSLSDTLVLTNYITVTNAGGPISANCTPPSNIGFSNYGIFNFSLNTINNTTLGAVEGYKDYTCAYNTTVTEGDYVNISINTGTTISHYVKVYFDANNDGIFSTTEEIFNDYAFNLHQSTVQIPLVSTYNSPLRMRVIADRYSITSTCSSSTNYSQIEDYSLTVLANTSPPVADFVADFTTVNTGSTVNYTSLSSGFPTSYLWSFPGASPTSSTVSNPSVIYNTVGLYNAQLIVNNAFGADTILKPNYITVTNQINMCSGPASSTAQNGLLYDSGGPTGNYSNSENCYFLIQPACADSIILSFSQFNTESGYDRLRIYDGANTAAPLIATLQGTSLPSDVVATSGSMYIYFQSDGSVIRSGFDANWSTVVTSANPPVANFSISNTNPPIGSPVQFTDLSTNSPVSWLWNFGDGSTSILQNPTHSYLSSGTHTVTLIVSTCGHSDTVSQTINVQAAPILSVNPSNYTHTFNTCNDSATIDFTVYNTGTGDLYIDTIIGSTLSDSLQSLEYFTSSGQNTLHNFNALPTALDSLYLTINLDGDFDGGSEYARLIIDGVDLGIIPDFNATVVSYATVLFGTQLANFIADGSIAVLIDNSSTVDVFSTNNNFHEVIVEYGSDADWIDIISSGGIISPGDSTVFSVTISNSDLVNGTYSDSISIYSNYLVNNPFYIPVTIINNGLAEMSVDINCLDFDTLFQNVSDSLPLEIYNSGCDTLNIQGLNFNTGDFSSSLSNLNIAPNETDTFWVNVSSTTIGQVLDTLTITTNANDTTICLSVFIEGAPDIITIPDTINATIYGCNDSIVIPVNAYNIGMGTLESSILTGSSSSTNSNGVFFDGFENGNLTNWNVSSSTNISISTFLPASGSYCINNNGADSHFNGMDVDFGHHNPDYVSFDVKTNSFTSANAYFVIGDDNTTTSYMTFMYAYNGGWRFYVNGTTEVLVPGTLNQWTHIELKNINYTTYTYDIYTDGILRQSNFPFRANISYLSQLYLYNFNSASCFYDNINIGGNSFNGADWISSDTDTLNISGGDSTLFNVTLNSTNLSNGVYSSSILLETNSPATPQYIIPVNLTVIGNAEINLEANCLEFDTIIQNDTTSESFYLYNTGCDTLFVTNISTPNSAYSINNTNFYILPGDSFTFDVTFNPTTLGNYNSTLLIENSDTDTTICLNGFSAEPPIIYAAPNPLHATTGCGNTISKVLQISNTFGGNLYYDIEQINSMYDSTSTIYYTSTGENTVHNFGAIATNSDSIHLVITLNGDYDSSSEYVTVYVDGTNVGIFNPTITASTISMNFSFGGTQVTNWLSDGQLTVTLDNSSSVNTGYGTQLNQVQVISESANNWLSVLTNLSDTVANGDTIDVLIEFDASNLNAGIYTDTLLIHSNDYAHSPLEIPVQFTVTGQSSISITPSIINFGSLLVGASSSATLYIENNGCDSLDITSFISSNTSFTVSPNNLVIAPFGSDSVIITFIPSAIQTYNDAISITNNDTTAFVLVQGEGVGAPAMSINPDEIIDTVFGCNDSITIPINIYNTGQGFLEVEVLNSTSGNTSNGFFEGFESGNISSWTNESGTYLKNVVTTNPATGSYCLHFDNGQGSLRDGISRTLPSLQPSEVSFKVKNTVTNIYGAFAYFDNAIGNSMLYFYQTNNGRFLINGNTTATTYAANVWYKIDYKNIDWTTKTGDLYIDDVLIYSALSFANTTVNSLDKVHLFTYTNGDCFIDDVQIGELATPDWLSLATDSIYVPLNDSAILDVTLNSTGLGSGTYNSEIIISSNDPITPFDTIPISFTVVGEPEIGISTNCLHFDSIVQNTTKLDSFYLFNSGCDSLFITNISSSNSAYTANHTSFAIAPGDSFSIEVLFAPTSIGSFNATLLIENSDSDTTICLTGYSSEPPIINVFPNPISANSNCGSTVSTALNIYNSGVGNLIYNIQNSSDSAQILALTNGVDMFTEYPNTINAINTYFTKYSITELNTTSATILQQNLTGKNIILIPEVESGVTTYFSSFANTLQNFANAGGTVIICGNSNNDIVIGSGLFTGAYSNFLSSGVLNASLPNHFLLDSTTTPINALSATLICNFTNPNINKVVTYNNNSAVAHRSVGSGQAIYVGYDYYNVDANASRIIANAVKSVTTGSAFSSDWVDLSIHSDTLDVNDTSVVIVTLDASTLSAGTYYDTIFVESNDLANTPVAVPVEFIVSGQANIVVNPNSIDFGTLQIGASETDTVIIENTGCDTLHLSSFLATNTSFTVNSNSMSIAPFSSDTIFITFTPNAIQTFNDTVYIYNSDSTAFVLVNGIGVGAPAISVNPNPIIDVINSCNASFTYPIYIYNTGQGDLNWNTISNTNITDDFEGGTNSSLWSSILGGVSSDACGTNNGTGALYFNGITRTATTLGFNTSLSNGTIDFYLKFGTGSSPCEDADSGENVVLEYSTNGGTNWVNINTYLSSSYSFFTLINENIPAAASSTNTMFRWRQTSFTGSGYDNWSIDDVSINTSSGTTVTPSNGTTGIGDTTIVYLTLNSSDFVGGVYTNTLYINSNDPINPVLTIPINLTLQTAPNLSISNACINFGTIALNSSNSNNSLLITNTGCANMIITNVYTTNANMTANATSIVLAPGANTTLNVNYTPLSPGPITDSIHIQTTGGDTVICVNGTVLGSAEIEITPNTLLSSGRLCEAFENDTIFIKNNGIQNLNWSYNQQANYPSLSPSAGTVTPGDSTMVIVSYLSINISSSFNFNMTINSNDPVNSSMTFSSYLQINTEPCPDFNFQTVSSCDGVVQFNDASSGNVVSYNWNFGDGNTSTQANPQNIYSTSGNYTVELIVCGTNICDTISQNISISVGNLVTNASCYPIATNPSANTGIQNVLLNTLNNSSSNSLEGFQDYSCSLGTEVLVNQNNGITINTFGNSSQSIRVWIDYNNDGNFSGAELVLNSFNSGTHTGNIIPPTSSIIDTRLRMRVKSNSTSANNGPCNNPIDGQVEDYYIIVKNSLAPIANYSYSVGTNCSGIVNFTDNSSPQATSWLWNFGDGNTSTAQNPTHQYTTSGSYIVNYTATNAAGSNNYSQTINVNVFTVSFNYTGSLVIGQTIDFNPTGNNINSWNWDFGDGNGSNISNPSNIYTNAGTYIVQFNAGTDQNCSASYLDTLEIGKGIAIVDVEDEINASLYPNPNNGSFYFEYEGNSKNLNLSVYTITGKLISSESHFVNKKTIVTVENKQLAKGLYYLEMKDDKYNKVFKFLVE